MQILIEVKKNDSQYEGIVIFPDYLKDEVVEILESKKENNWIMNRSTYSGHMQTLSNFSSSKEAFSWANKISDQICLIKV